MGVTVEATVKSSHLVLGCPAPPWVHGLVRATDVWSLWIHYVRTPVTYIMCYAVLL